MSAITSAISAGVHAAARPLTAELRQAAAKSGWDAKAARGLRVSVKGTKPPALTVNANQAAQSAEYGGLGQAPNAVVRKWANKKKPVEQVLIAAVAERLEKIL